MYGFGEDLTKENIFKRITSYDIFKFYSENFVEVGKSFVSDVRSDDDDPSAQINVIKGDLLYTDFGMGKSFRCIDYVMYKYNLNYFEALQRINLDFNLKLGIFSNTPKTSLSPTIHYGIEKKLKEKQPAIIQKKQKEFTKKDLEYWNSFYWTEWMLNKAKTQSISHYWINEYSYIVPKDELAFSYEYYWHNGRMQRKLYFPEREKKKKWYSNVDNTVVQLVDVAPKEGDILFITSSKKDGGIFWRIELEKYFSDLVIHGVAPNNEGVFVPEEWYEKMKTRWKRIILWYNNDWHKKDNPGVTNSKKISERYKLEWYVNPDGMEKDPSDFSKSNSLDNFVELIKNKLEL